MKTGELLWTSHARGWRGRVVHAFDYVPGFTNEFRDTPHHIKDGEVFCNSGRVVDVLTGTEVRRVSREEVQQVQEPRSEALRLYDGIAQNVRTRIEVRSNKWLSHKKSELDDAAERFQLYLLDEDDAVLWRWNSYAVGMHVDGNFYSYRYVSRCNGTPFIYLVASEEPSTKEHSSRPYYLQNSTRYHLLSFNVLEGRVVGDTLVDDGKASDCRIEDCDELGVLVSVNRTQLKYYRHSSVTPQ